MNPMKVENTISSTTQLLRSHTLPLVDMHLHIPWFASDDGVELDRRRTLDGD